MVAHLRFVVAVEACIVEVVMLAAALILPLRLLASLVVEDAMLRWGLASGLVVALIVVLPAQAVTALAP